MDFSSVAKRFGKFASDNSPAILTAVGVVGTLTTAYLTAKATITAKEIVEYESAKRNYDYEAGERLEAREIVAATWTCYIPAASSAALTIAAIVAANRISDRRAAGIAAAFAITEKAFSEYKSKVADKFGTNKEQGLRDDIAQDHVRNNPPRENTVIITNEGDVLCRDEYSGRYFRSSAEAIRKAQNDINFRILHEGDASLTDFYNLIGLSKTTPSDTVGWNTDRPLEIYISWAGTQDEKPCLCVEFDVQPYPNFYNAG